MNKRKRLPEILVISRNGAKGITYQYRFEGIRINGKRNIISKSGFKTEEEAYAEGDKRRYEYYHADEMYSEEITKAKMHITFYDYVQTIFLPEHEGVWKPSTYASYKKLINNILIPSLGKDSLSGISSIKLKEFFNELYQNTPYSISSIRNLKTLTNQIFKYAVAGDFLNKSPMELVNRINKNITPNVSKRKQVRQPLPSGVLDKIQSDISPVGSTYHIPYMLARYAGLRLSEAFGICVEDIDFQNHCIYICRQLRLIDSTTKFSKYQNELIESYNLKDDIRFHTENCKDNSARVVPMTSELETTLKGAIETQSRNRLLYGKFYKRYWYTRKLSPKFKERSLESFGVADHNSLEYCEEGIINEQGLGYEIRFINVRDNGELVSPNSMQQFSAKIQGKSSTDTVDKNFNFHSLRNTFASELRSAGISEELISKFMGHKSMNTTEIYLDVTMAQFKKATELMQHGLSASKSAFEKVSMMNLSDEDKKELAEMLLKND